MALFLERKSKNKLPETSNRSKKSNGQDASNENGDDGHSDALVAVDGRGDVELPGEPLGRYDKFFMKLGIVRRESRIGILGMIALALLLFIIVIILAARLSERRTFDESQICLEPACLESSAALRSSISMGVIPCENIWEFSCGNWVANNPIPSTESSWSVLQKLRSETLMQYRTILNTLPQPMDPEGLDWNMVTFYSSCMDLENINIDGARYLKDDIRELGGWAVIRNWNRNSFDKDLTLRRLHAKYHVEPLFSISVVPDDTNIGMNIVKISQPKLGLPDGSFYYRPANDRLLTDYIQYIEDTVKELGAPGPDAKQFALNIFYLEKRIVELMPLRQEYSNPVLAYHRLTLGELRTKANGVQWLEIIREMYPDAGVNQNTEVLIVSEKFVEDVSQMFSANDMQGLNNFLMWKLAAKMSPFLSKEYRALYDLYSTKITGADAQQTRWDFCTEALENVFGHALKSIFYKNMENRRSSEEAVEKIFARLKSVLSSEVEGGSGFEEETKKSFITKLRSMKLQVGYPENMMEKKYLESLYQRLTVQKNGFYRNIFYGDEYKRFVEQEALIRPTDDLRWREELLSRVPVYVHRSNLLIVPAELLQTPFFDGNYPRSFIYGSVGVMMARAMLSAVDEIGVHYSAEGILEFPSSAMTLNISPIQTCVNESLAEITDLPLVVDSVMNCTAKDIGGLNLAMMSLDDSLEEEAELPQPGVPFDPFGIFFTSAANIFCGSAKAKQEEIDSVVNQCLPNKQRLREAFRHVSEFGDAFSCNGQDWSSSSPKCDGIFYGMERVAFTCLAVYLFYVTGVVCVHDDFSSAVAVEDVANCVTTEHDNAWHISCSSQESLDTFCSKDPQLPVKSLQLSASTSVDLSCLKKFKDLREISLDLNHAKGSHVLAQSLLQSVEVLMIKNTDLSGEVVRFSGGKKLQKLVLHSCGLDNVEWIRKIVSSASRNFRTLDLSNNRLNMMDLCKVFSNSHLEEIRMQGNDWRGSLPKKCFNDHVKVLDLSSNPGMDLSLTSLPGNLVDLILRSNALRRIPMSVISKIITLKSLDVSGNDIICDCGAKAFANAMSSGGAKVTGAVCEFSGGEIVEVVSELNCVPVTVNATSSNGPVRSGHAAILTCDPNDPAASITWVTPKNLVLHWFSPDNSSEFVHHPTLHLDVVEPVAKPEAFSRFVLDKNGRRLVVHDFNRRDVGFYHCVVDNGFSNDSHVFRVHMHHENMLDLELSSIITGASFSVSFFLLVLIVQLARMMVDRWGCCCSDNISPRAKRVGKMIQALEAYRCQQMEWLRESYGMQVKRLREYSAQQMGWVHESYMQGRLRVRRYTGQQMVRLRETYKIQQKTFNKIIENMPDLRPDACRTRIDDDDDLDIDDVEIDLRFLDQIVAEPPEVDGVDMDDDDDDESSRYYTPPDGRSPERVVVPQSHRSVEEEEEEEDADEERNALLPVVIESDSVLPIVIVEQACPVEEGECAEESNAICTEEHV
ncbi:unnamed protein product [Notodromas monacha]|uniref:Ig-like domain-containing protein n=1 Tax=Notodromas monacha TaxID=399045 RepID=A0A7R9BTY9_9CRUS|nr:unnamed protein product [Notodromas monacha]CAG0921699.1 unnamed protein product [Notodromas monacha]